MRVRVHHRVHHRVRIRIHPVRHACRPSFIFFSKNRKKQEKTKNQERTNTKKSFCVKVLEFLVFEFSILLTSLLASALIYILIDKTLSYLFDGDEHFLPLLQDLGARAYARMC